MTTQYERKQITLLVSIIMGLLTLTAGGVGWLIIQNHERLKNHEERLESLQGQMNDLRNISSNLIEAYNGKVDKDRQQDSAIEKQRDEILELWKCAKRSGNKELTLKE